MTIATTNDIIAPILQSLAPGMLAVPTPDFIYRIPADRDTMPRQGGTTIRFLRPRLLSPPIVALGNSGIEPPSQVPQRDIKDAIMDFYSTSVIINEQTVLQNQDSVLSWIMERLGVAAQQARTCFGLYKFLLIVLKTLTGKAEGNKEQATLRCAA